LPRAADRSAPPATVIRPPQAWQLINFRELWQYRELVYFLTWRDVKVRYKQTALGAAWAVLQPLLMMVVFTILFSRMASMAPKDLAYPYAVFVYAGMLPWTFFATAIANAGNSVVGSERLITKIYFPRLAVPFASVAAAVVDFVIAMGLLAAFMVWYRVPPGWGLLLAPVVYAMIVLLALGMGTLLAALNVAYRDFRYVIPFLVQLWLLATPTIYTRPSENPSPLLAVLLNVNPMAGLIEAFRATTLGGPLPWGRLGIASACAVVLFLVGCLYFRKVEDNFADII
jgi:lipopolysaccharide transport system permease protein